MPRLVLLSDTHGLHYKVDVPDGDILVFAGDMCNKGAFHEAEQALYWLNNQPHKHVVAIAGNHDWAFEKPHLQRLLDFGRVEYLEDSAATVEGLKFYGSPQTPEFMGWAFNVARGAAIKTYWDMIPEDTDVLVTHGPPRGILDQSAPLFHSELLGCDDLFEAVDRINPKLHVFGHIHGGYGQIQFGKGTKFFNASICDEAYRPVNRPIVVDI